jgi:hypothetical protein
VTPRGLSTRPPGRAYCQRACNEPASVEWITANRSATRLPRPSRSTANRSATSAVSGRATQQPCTACATDSRTGTARRSAGRSAARSAPARRGRCNLSEDRPGLGRRTRSLRGWSRGSRQPSQDRDHVGDRDALDPDPYRRHQRDGPLHWHSLRHLHAPEHHGTTRWPR